MWSYSSYCPIHRHSIRELVEQFRPDQKLPAAWLWYQMLNRANQNRRDTGQWVLERGQFFYGTVELAEAALITRSTTRTLINRFKKLGELTTESFTREALERSSTSILTYTVHVQATGKSTSN